MGLVRLNGKSGCFPCSLLHSICSLTLTGGLKVPSMCPEVSALPNTPQTMLPGSAVVVTQQ